MNFDKLSNLIYYNSIQNENNLYEEKYIKGGYSNG